MFRTTKCTFGISNVTQLVLAKHPVRAPRRCHEPAVGTCGAVDCGQHGRFTGNIELVVQPIFLDRLLRQARKAGARIDALNFALQLFANFRLLQVLDGTDLAFGNVSRNDPAKLGTFIERPEIFDLAFNALVVIGVGFRQPCHHHGIDIATAHALIEWGHVCLNQFDLLAEIVFDQLLGKFCDEFSIRPWRPADFNRLAVLRKRCAHGHRSRHNCRQTEFG